MAASDFPNAAVRKPFPEPEDVRTVSLSESSEDESTPIRLVDRSSLDRAVKHWDAALEPFGAAALNETNADSFSRFLWRLDVAIDLSGRDARLSVAPWLRTLAGNEQVRRQCFRLAAEEENSGQRTIAQIYQEMRGFR